MVVFYHQVKILIDFRCNLKNFTNQLELTKFLGINDEFLRKLIYLLRQFNSLANFVLHFALIPSPLFQVLFLTKFLII